jgi:hypothetical protein
MVDRIAKMKFSRWLDNEVQSIAGGLGTMVSCSALSWLRG